MNTVRLSFNSWGGPGWISNFSSAQECIDHFVGVAVEALKAKEIYSILDAHEYMCDWKMGVDDWMPSGPPFGVDNPSWQCQRWLDDWVYIADYYKDEPWVLGYELCNEPQDVPYDEAWKVRKNYMKCIEKIREVDTRHLVILGTA